MEKASKLAEIKSEMNRRNFFAKLKDEDTLSVGVKIIEGFDRKGVSPKGVPLIEVNLEEEDLDKDTIDFCDDLEDKMDNYLDGELNDELPEDKQTIDAVKDIINRHKVTLNSIDRK